MAGSALGRIDLRAAPVTLAAAKHYLPVRPDDLAPSLAMRAVQSGAGRDMTGSGLGAAYILLRLPVILVSSMDDGLLISHFR